MMRYTTLFVASVEVEAMEQILDAAGINKGLITVQIYTCPWKVTRVLYVARYADHLLVYTGQAPQRCRSKEDNEATRRREIEQAKRELCEMLMWSNMTMPPERMVDKLQAASFFVWQGLNEQKIQKQKAYFEDAIAQGAWIIEEEVHGAGEAH